MGPLPLVLGVVALAALAGFVVAPLVRARPAPDDGGSRGGAELEALDRRDRALAALRELELDHRTGKVGDDDYASLLGPLRIEAARALQDVDRSARSR